MWTVSGPRSFIVLRNSFGEQVTKCRCKKTTVWKVLRKRLHMRAYRLQFVHALKPDDYALRFTFACAVLGRDDDLLDRVVFSDESTFHLRGKVNAHNVRIWGLKIRMNL